MFTFRYKDPATRDAAKAAAQAALRQTLKIEYKDPNTMIMKDAPGIIKTMAKIHSDLGIPEPKFKTNLTRSSIKPNDIVTNKSQNFFYGSYYQIPTGNAPVFPPRIGIISLGGSYLSNDLKLAWADSGRTDPYKEPRYVILPGSTYIPNSLPDEETDSWGYHASLENSLDLQLIMTNSPPNAVITIYMAQYSYYGFIMALARADIDNHIISCSWGVPEVSLNDALLLSFNKTFSRVVSNGTAMLAASGDTGSRPFYYSGGDNYYTLSVNFPACSPYCIGCGGTALSFVGQQITGETGWSGSGGGTSYIFPKPSYQSSLSGPNYRQVPDISMAASPEASPWSVFFNGSQTYVGGTSCVAPAFSGYLSWFFTNKTIYDGEFGILNNIYAATNSFRDITQGTNDPDLNDQYDCGPGYDMVTGLGSPIGRNLAAQLQI